MVQKTMTLIGLTSLLLIVFDAINSIECECLRLKKTDRNPQKYQQLFVEQHRLGWDLFTQMNAENPEENVLISPYSIQKLLTLAYYVSNGTSEQKFHDALRIPSDQEKVDVIYASRNEYTERKHHNPNNLYEFLSADRLYVDSQQNLRKASCIQQTLRAYTSYINFRNTARAAKRINNWIEEQTRNHIVDAIQPDDLRNAELLLINAVYFKGTWESIFDTAATRDGAFTLASGEQVTHPMMSQLNTFNSGTSKNYKMLELPYKGGEVSMYILLPHKHRSVNDVLQELTVTQLQQSIDTLQEDIIDVQIPKFSIKTDYDLIPTLRQVGFHEVIQQPVDLSLILDHRNGFIDKVMHKATINVDEVGTVATAVTFAMLPRMLPRSFICTRPFIYLIQSKRTKHVLFAGVLRKPKFE